LIKFDIGNALSGEPSRAELLRFLDANGTTQAAESAYKWIAGKSLHSQQLREAVARGQGSATAATMVTSAGMNLWEVLSRLADIAERIEFSIDVSLQNETLVVVITDVPEEDNAAAFVQELLALVFARLSNAEPQITHTKNTATARILMG
jgi:hypothetical protein